MMDFASLISKVQHAFRQFSSQCVIQTQVVDGDSTRLFFMLGVSDGLAFVRVIPAVHVLAVRRVKR